MLETYAALLPGAEEDPIALLEGRRSPSTHSFPSSRNRRSMLGSHVAPIREGLEPEHSRGSHSSG